MDGIIKEDLLKEKEEYEARKKVAVPRWWEIREKLVTLYRALGKGLSKDACGIVIHEGSGVAVRVEVGSQKAGWLLMWITLAEYILEKEDSNG